MTTQHKLLKAKKRRADYEKKRNVAKNNKKGGRYICLTAGDGTLPKSKKYTNKKSAVQK